MAATRWGDVVGMKDDAIGSNPTATEMRSHLKWLGQICCRVGLRPIPTSGGLSVGASLSLARFRTSQRADFRSLVHGAFLKLAGWFDRPAPADFFTDPYRVSRPKISAQVSSAVLPSVYTTSFANRWLEGCLTNISLTRSTAGSTSGTY